MKIFPLILIRIAGLPLKTLQSLRWPDEPLLTSYFYQQSEIQRLRQQLNDALKEAIQQQSSYPLKTRLSNFRSDLFNHRKWQVEKIRAALSTDSPIPQMLQNLLEWKEKALAFQQNFIPIYHAQLLQDRKQLQLLAANERLHKGLLLSSHSFYQRLLSYRNKDIADFRKKEAQTERSLLQYLGRMGAKTSPFSTFTHLALQSLDTPFDVPEERPLESQFLLNNVILAHLQELLERYPPFYKDLKIQRNESIEQSAGEYRFLMNSHNLEAFQYMERTDILDFFYASSEQAQPFGAFQQGIAQEVDAPEEALVQYFQQLIDYGFLEWRWPVEYLGSDWPNKLSSHLQATSDALLSDLGEALEALNKDRQNLAEADSQERLILLRTAQSRWTAAVSLLRGQIHLPEPTKAPDAFQRQQDIGFNISPEKLFYEDCQQPATLPFAKSSLNPIITILKQFLQHIRPLQTTNHRLQLTSFFQNHYPKEACPSVLDFYEAYYQSERVAPATNVELHDLQRNWRSRLGEELEIEGEGHLNIELSVLENWSSPADLKETYWSASKSSLLLPFEEAGDLKAFTDAVMPGFGKMMGRFLHLFPESVAEQLREDNRQFVGNSLWVENRDSSFFNANQQPSLWPYELRIPGGRNQAPLAQQLSITELGVRLNENGSDLEIIHQPSGQSLRVLNMGLEALGSRSRLYQLLAAFGPEVPSLSRFTTLVNEEFVVRRKDGRQDFPRISIDGRLCIQRRHWYLPKALLPLQAGGESAADYFLRIQNWRWEMGFGAQVYITLNPPQSDSVEKGVAKEDDYKPQYIDFESPLWVQLLARLLKRVPAYLKIEEALPGEALGGEQLQELLVQWSE